MTFPFVPLKSKIGNQNLPNPDTISVIFYPATAGHLVGMLLSCDSQFYGSDHAQTIINKFRSSYDAKTSRSGWMDYHTMVHPSIYVGHSRWWPFEFYLQLNNIVRVQYSCKEEETKFILYRLKFLRNSSLHSLDHAEAQYHYDNALFNFLENNNKNYHNIPFVSFLKTTSFIVEINKLFEHYNFKFLDTNVLKEIHKVWMKENHNQFKQSLTLTHEDKKNFWDDY